MKKRIIIYIMIGIMGSFLILRFLTAPSIGQLISPSRIYNEFFKKNVFPNAYCNQFSGTASYAWGSMNEIKCKKAGCKIKIIRETDEDPMVFDDEGYEFECIK